MPFARKRRPFKRRPFKRRAPMFRSPRFRKRTQIYPYKQHAQLANMVVNSGVTEFFQYSFHLSDLPQAATFTELYDQYRILAVKITFFPEFNVFFQVATGNSFVMPILYTVIDYDTEAIPTSLAQLYDYTNLKKRFFKSPVTRYFKPQAGYSTGAINGASVSATIGGNVSRKQWFNTNQPGVAYVGIRGSIDCATLTQLPPSTIRVVADYYIQFRNVR